MNLWWTCPNCGAKVDFTNELIGTCFDKEDGEAYFTADENGGIIFHTIFCTNCNACWTISIDGMSKEFIRKPKSVSD